MDELFASEPMTEESADLLPGIERLRQAGSNLSHQVESAQDALGDAAQLLSQYAQEIRDAVETLRTAALENKALLADAAAASQKVVRITETMEPVLTAIDSQAEALRAAVPATSAASPASGVAATLRIAGAEADIYNGASLETLRLLLDLLEKN